MEALESEYFAARNTAFSANRSQQIGAQTDFAEKGGSESGVFSQNRYTPDPFGSGVFLMSVVYGGSRIGVFRCAKYSFFGK